MALGRGLDNNRRYCLFSCSKSVSTEPFMELGHVLGARFIIMSSEPTLSVGEIVCQSLYKV